MNSGEPAPFTLFRASQKLTATLVAQLTYREQLIFTRLDEMNNGLLLGSGAHLADTIHSRFVLRFAQQIKKKTHSTLRKY